MNTPTLKKQIQLLCKKQQWTEEDADVAIGCLKRLNEEYSIYDSIYDTLYEELTDCLEQYGEDNSLPEGWYLEEM